MQFIERATLCLVQITQAQLRRERTIEVLSKIMMKSKGKPNALIGTLIVN
jgi:hypothetical protein